MTIKLYRWLVLFVLLTIPAGAQISSNATRLRNQNLCNPLTPVSGSALVWNLASRCWGPSGAGNALAGNALSATTPASDTLCAKGADTISGITCNNAADSPGGATLVAFNTLYTIPANYWAQGVTLRVTAQFNQWTSSSPPAMFNGVVLSIGAANLYANFAPTVTVSMTKSGWSASWVITGASATTVIANALSFNFPGGTTALTRNAIPMPATVTVASPQTLTIQTNWNVATPGNAIQLLSLLVERVN